VIVWLLHFVSVRVENENSTGGNKFVVFVYFLGTALFYPGFLLSLVWPGVHGWHADLLPTMAEIYNDIFYAFVVAALVLKFRRKCKSL
jgi:hypothetical protein